MSISTVSLVRAPVEWDQRGGCPAAAERSGANSMLWVFQAIVTAKTGGHDKNLIAILGSSSASGLPFPESVSSVFKEMRRHLPSLRAMVTAWSTPSPLERARLLAFSFLPKVSIPLRRFVTYQGITGEQRRKNVSAPIAGGGPNRPRAAPQRGPVRAAPAENASAAVSGLASFILSSLVAPRGLIAR